MTKYGGDPTKFQLRDMNRRITALEKGKDRSDARIKNLRADLKIAQTAISILRAILVAKDLDQ